MYKCWHCEDLHFAAHQARSCWELGDSWRAGFEEAEARHVFVPWDKKQEYRRDHLRTDAERELLRLLSISLPRERFLVEWWLDDQPFRVDCLIDELVIEVDGPWHLGREGHDRHRSSRIRADGYEVLRVTNDDVLTRGAEIVAQVAQRVAARSEGWPSSDPQAA